MDGSLKSIQTQSYICLEDGICKICRAPLRLGGALKQKTKLPVWVCQLPGRNAKSQYPCWEVKMQRTTTTTKSPRGFLGIHSFPILYSFGVDEHQQVPAWLAILLLEDCWCVQVVAVHQEWKVKAPSCLWALLEWGDELKWWNRRARKTGLRPKKFWFFRKQNRTFFKIWLFCSISF